MLKHILYLIAGLTFTALVCATTALTGGYITSDQWMEFMGTLAFMFGFGGPICFLVYTMRY